MSSTSIANTLCPLCVKFSEQITGMTDLLLRLERDGISTFRLQAVEIAQVFSEARSIIEAVVDTWSRHLQSTHQDAFTNGTLPMTGMAGADSRWSLKVSSRWLQNQHRVFLIEPDSERNTSTVQSGST